MKPILLTIDGLNSFSTKQVIDFEALSSRGVFGIFGKTGSGKSTVLDAITLALYGKVSRSKVKTDFINIKKRETNVSLTFDILTKKGEKRFEISRRYKLKKNNKEADSFATLIELVDGERKVVKEGTYNVDAYILELLGLSMEEFCKCIALPQGEFASFLKCKPNERIEIIGNIFDLSKYGAPLWEKVKIEVNSLEKEQVEVLGGINALNGVSDEELEIIKQSLDEKEMELKTLTEKILKLKKDISELDIISQKIAGLEENKKRLTQLEIDKIEIDKQKEDIQFFEKNKNYVDVSKKLNVLKKERELANLSINDKIIKLDNLKQELCELERTIKVLKSDYQNSLITFSKLETKSKQVEETLYRLKTLKEALINLQNDKNIIENKQNEILEKIQNLTDEQKEREIKKGDLQFELNNLLGVDEATVCVLDSEIKAIKLVERRLEDLKKETETDLNKNKIDFQNFANELSLNSKAFEKACETLGIESREDEVQIKIRKEEERKAELDKIIFSMKNLDNEKEEYNKRIEELKIKILGFDKNIDEEKTKLLSVEKELSKVNAELNKLEEEKDGYIGEHFMDLLIDQVNIGDVCPVCRSNVIQKSPYKKADASGFYAQQKILMSNKKQIETLKSKVEFQISKLTSRIEFEQDEIKKLNDYITINAKKKDALLKQYVDINDEKMQNFYKIVENNEKMYKNLLKLDLIQKKLSEDKLTLEIKKSASGAYILSKKEFIESITELQRGLLKIIAEKELQLYNGSSESDDKKELFEKKKMIEQQIEILVTDETKFISKMNELKIMLSEINNKLILVNEKIDNNISEANRLNHSIPEEFKNVVDVKEVVNEKNKQNKLLADTFDKTTENLKDKQDTYNKIEREMVLLNQKIELLNENIKEIEESYIDFSEEDKIKFDMLYTQFEGDKLTLIKERFEDFDKEYILVENEIKEKERLKESVNFDENLLSDKKNNLKMLEQKKELLIVDCAKMQENVENMSKNLINLNILNEKLHKIEYKLKLANELKDLLRGRKLEEYVAEEFMQNIVDIASSKLDLLLEGRFELKFENSEFVVIDNFNDGIVRSVTTLSGGELFVVSLSLALAISESIVNLSNRNFDFFFLDEGFGSLDSELCETVVSSLYKLQSQNITIGVISHVPELQEKIKNKILIKKTESEGSCISYVYDF